MNKQDEVEKLRSLAEKQGFHLSKIPKKYEKNTWPEVLDKMNGKYDLNFCSVSVLVSYFYNEKHLSLREMEEEFGVSAQTIRLKMQKLGLKRRSKGGKHHKKLSLKPKHFGFQTEKEMIDCWRKRMSLKVITEVLNTFGIEIKYNTLRSRICKQNKEKKETVTFTNILLGHRPSYLRDKNIKAEEKEETK